MTKEKGTYPRVTVIVPTYNGANRLKRCIRSLLSLDYPKELLEVIIVDDGSTDGTSAILEKYDVRVIRHEINKGASAARNTGIKGATGDILLFIDDDVRVAQNLLKAVVKHYNGTVGGVGIPVVDEELAKRSPLFTFIGARNMRKQLGYSTRELRARGVDPNNLTLEEKLFFFSAPTTCLSYRKDVLNDLGGFDERIPYQGEDFELRNRVTDAGYNMVLAKDTKCFHLLETRKASWYGVTKKFFIQGVARSRVLKVMGKRLILHLPLNYLITRCFVFLGLFVAVSIVVYHLFSSYLLAMLLPLILLFLVYELKEGYNTAIIAGRKSLAPLFFLCDSLRSIIMSAGFICDMIATVKRNSNN